MPQTILILVGIITIVFLVSRKTRETAVGICATVIRLDAKKQENKEKILELLKKAQILQKGELSNSDIREALKISGRSVVRYMDELEKEGKVEQVGDTGRGVTYRLR